MDAETIVLEILGQSTAWIVSHAVVAPHGPEAALEPDETHRSVYTYLCHGARGASRDWRLLATTSESCRGDRQNDQRTRDFPHCVLHA
jgi:hypothetical protein